MIGSGSSRGPLAPFVAALLLLTAHTGHSASPIPGTVIRVQGSEGLSELYRFDFDVESGSDSIDLNDLVGTAGSFPLGRRTIHGVVTAAAWLGPAAGGAVYRITLEPEVALLRLHRRSRVFHDMSTSDVVTQVLQEAGIPSVWYSAGPILQHETIVQYQESDWAFVERLLAQEGHHYRFEHTADGHRLMVSDATPPASLTLLYDPGARRADAVHRLMRKVQIHSRAVGVETYDYTRPGHYEASAVAPDRAPPGQQAGYYMHGEGRKLLAREFSVDFDDTGAIERLADNRLGGELMREFEIEGSGNALLEPGLALRVRGVAQFGNGEYFVTAVRHTVENGRYRNEFVWLPREVRFVPRFETPKFTGLQPAIVVNTNDPERQFGRVEVRLPLGVVVWARVAQSQVKGQQIPEVGDEVVVAFEDGNPARPVVIGALYNAEDEAPYAQSDYGKVQGIGDSAASNDMMFGGVPGSELVRLRAAKDLNTIVENDQLTQVSRNQVTQVGSDQKTLIAGTAEIAAQQIVIKARDQVRIAVGDHFIVVDRRGIHLSQAPQTPVSRQLSPRP